MDIIIVYSKYSNACHKLNFALYSNKYLKTTQFKYLCIDNPQIRSKVVSTLNIKTVPCIAVYRRLSSTPDIFEGHAAFEWLEQFIQFAISKTQTKSDPVPTQINQLPEMQTHINTLPQMNVSQNQSPSQIPNPNSTTKENPTPTTKSSAADIMALAAAMEKERNNLNKPMEQS